MAQAKTKVSSKNTPKKATEKLSKQPLESRNDALQKVVNQKSKLINSKSNVGIIPTMQDMRKSAPSNVEEKKISSFIPNKGEIENFSNEIDSFKAQDNKNQNKIIQPKKNFNFKIKFPKISFPKLHLSQPQRIFLALVLTLILIGGVIYVNIYGFSLRPFQPKPAELSAADKAKQEILNNPLIQDRLQQLQNVADSYDPAYGIVKKIKYKDLPIYPDNWVKKHFSATQMRNALISGPDGDADGDGLSNKEEYLYGADPNLKNSLCIDPASNTEYGDKCNLTDKQLVTNRISPLTGLPIGDEDTDLIITNSDNNFLDSIQNSFEKASEEGVDFTTLYQLSKKIDITDQYSKVKVNSVPQNRQNTIDYLQFRSDFLKGFIQNSAVNSLIDIYKVSVLDEFKPVLADYKAKKESLEKAIVPEPQAEVHKRLTFVFEKLTELAQFRYDSIENKSFGTDDFKAKSEKLATEIVWAFRKLDEQSVSK